MHRPYHLECCCYVVDIICYHTIYLDHGDYLLHQTMQDLTWVSILTFRAGKGVQSYFIRKHY